jgi:DhnA family fructose-bisphosphate aldolase class Ia
MDEVGKARRMGRLFRSSSGKMLLVPFDDSLLAGPETGLRDIGRTLKDVIRSGADAIMCFPGLLKTYTLEMQDVAVIVNLTASTRRGVHTQKILFSSVEQAVRFGADCVGVHVNISSRYEPEMLAILGRVSADCEKLGMPLLGLMYPRGESGGVDYNYEDLKLKEPEKYTELVRHCVRIGAEMGVNVIKTHFTGSIESFRTVIESAMGVPVVIAGGPLESAESAFTKAAQCIQAGGSGISFGRNVFQRERPGDFVRGLRLIVHSGATVQEAMETFGR